MPIKKLFRSDNNKIIGGVLGGLGEYFEVDSNLLRLLWTLITLFTGIVPGIMVYCLAVIIVPRSPQGRTVSR